MGLEAHCLADVGVGVQGVGATDSDRSGVASVVEASRDVGGEAADGLGGDDLGGRGPVAVMPAQRCQAGPWRADVGRSGSRPAVGAQLICAAPMGTDGLEDEEMEVAAEFPHLPVQAAGVNSQGVAPGSGAALRAPI